jgi:hypothetical protein
MRTSIWWAPLVLAVLIHAGCSFSHSSKSSSDSSASSSRSSSASSEGSESRYKRDVRDYTAAWAKSGGQLDAFQKKLGELAKQYGITNWEDNEATYVGIGEGLADAKVSKVQFEAYRDNLARSDPAKAKAIQTGYDSRK